jgi:hypothetical protein
MVIETGILVAVVAVVVEAVKRFFALDSRFLPLLAIVLGVATAYIQNLDIFVGVLIGASACGLYDLSKKTVLGK